MNKEHIYTNPKPDFFQIVVNREGDSYITRLRKLAAWIFWISVLSSPVFLVHCWLGVLMQQEIPPQEADLVLDIELILSVVYTLLGIPLVLLQSYLYLRFVRTCKKSIDSGQPDLFNSSFKYLVQHAICTISIFTYQVLFVLYDNYVGVYLLQRAQTAT